MMLEDQYGVGDVIDFEQASGTVEAVGLRTTRLRDVNGTVWYVRNGEVVRVGNKSQGYAQVVLDVPIDAWARRPTGLRRDARRSRSEMRDEDEWSPVFLSDPEVQGVESITREETVIRLVARTRPASSGASRASCAGASATGSTASTSAAAHEPEASTPRADDPADLSPTRRRPLTASQLSARHAVVAACRADNSNQASAWTASSTARCSVGNA